MLSLKFSLISAVVFILALSFNQPKLCSYATWNPNAITLATGSTVSKEYMGIFIDLNNTIYLANRLGQRIHIWSSSNVNTIRKISSDASLFSIFVTISGYIYIDNGIPNGRVDKFLLNSNTTVPVMYVNYTCSGLFIDMNDTLYCSMREHDQVIKKWLNDSTNTTSIAVGTGVSGSASNMLNSPVGIFVDINIDLYVADSRNHRIQLFRLGKLNGMTVAGEGSSRTTIKLNNPHGIVLDADKYLFIVDRENNRIVGSGPYGFRCIVGCSKSSGSASNQLFHPWTLAFDSYGSIFVTDYGNNRIQKFVLSTNSCDIPSLNIFNPPACDDPTRVGLICIMSNSLCALLNPCQNNGTCRDNTSEPHGYTCSCVERFNGTQCQSDYQLCKPDTCWNGYCDDKSTCVCHSNWKGSHCETKINYCENVTCYNNGICRPLIGNFTCECLGNSYSGSHCEIVATKIKIYKIVSKSFAYIAIIAMICVAMFIIIMDILKYCFGIDPTREDLERIQRERRAKNRKPVIQRFIYVNAPEQSVAAAEETTVQDY